MAMNKTPLTPQEVRGSYEYKLAKRLIKDEFPFVKDVDVEDDKLNQYGLIFLKLYVDPFELSEYYDTPLYWGLVYRKLNDPSHGFSSPFLSTLLDNPEPRLTVEFEKDVGDILDSIRNSKVIPDHMKLPSDRSLSVGHYITTDNFVIPQKYKEEFVDRYPELRNIIEKQGGV